MQIAITRWLERPLPFAAIVVAVHLLLLWPLAARRNFDLSIFIYAGDGFASAKDLPAPVTVFPNTLGYDGQFFYRIALDPLSVAASAYGITLDTPAKRMQRILYPVLAWSVALGRVQGLPASLLGVNLAGLGVIAACAAWLARRRRLARWLPFAVVAWPGFLVAVTHDTAEIVSTGLMLTALACYLSDRLWPYCLLAMLAALTRETTIPVFLGPVACEAFACATRADRTRCFGRVVPCALTFVPFGIWWLTISLVWHQAPQSLGGSPDLGWPLAGVLALLHGAIAGTRSWSADPVANCVIRIFVLWTICGLMAFCAAVLLRLPSLMRRPGLGGLAIGWLLTVVLMSLLTAGGPLVDPLAFFRAFSECWVVGCLLFAHDPPVLLHRTSVFPIATLLATQANAVVWKWTLESLR